MIKWLWRLIWGKGCDHEWEYFYKSNHYAEINDPLPRRSVYHYTCKKCLKHKQIEIK